MAFDKDKIIKLGNLPPATDTSDSLSHWLYYSTQAMPAVKAAGFFNEWRPYLLVGDLIETLNSDGRHCLKVATVPKVGNVTVTDVSGLASVAAGGMGFVGGVHTTVAAADTKVTGLASVVACGASLQDDPGDDPYLVTGSIGDQAGSPAAGSILLKTFKNTSGTDPTPVAATTFGKKVGWWAYGAT